MDATEVQPPAPELSSDLGSLSTCQAAGTGTEAAASYVNASWVPRASRIFDALSIAEVESVQSFVQQQLGLESSGYPNSTSNFIFRILLEEPDKAAALAWLDAVADGEEAPEVTAQVDAIVNGDGAADVQSASGDASGGSASAGDSSPSSSTSPALVLPPPRYAHVIVFRGQPRFRDMMEYRVGPLPLSPSTATIVQRRPDGEVPFTKHPIDGVSGQWTAVSVLTDADVLKDVFRDITGGHCYGVEGASGSDVAVAANARETTLNATASNGTARAGDRAVAPAPEIEEMDETETTADGGENEASSSSSSPSSESSSSSSSQSDPLDVDRTYTSLPPVINRFAPSGGYECDMSYIVFLEYPVVQEDPQQRVAVIKWQFQPDGWGDEAGYLFPLPLSWKVNETAEDSDDWTSFDFEYCHQGPFASAEELLEAFGNGTLRRCANTDLGDPDYDASWARTDRNYARDTQVLDDEDGGSEMNDSNAGEAVQTGADGQTVTVSPSPSPSPVPGPAAESWTDPARALSEDGGVTVIRPRPASRAFAPEGYRFELSSLANVGRAIRGLGWTAHVTLRPDTGLVLHDVRFRNERVVYELAQQDMFVAYSGYGGAGQTIYMDSVYGIGVNSRPLKRGYDCPWGAAYLGSELNYGFFGAAAQSDVLCVFEHDPQMPAWRHTHVTDARGAHADGARGAHLAMRTIATIGNYDYIFTVHLEQDGSIDVTCTMAGYMSALFSDPLGATWRDAPFGTRVHSHTLAHIHDHMSGWKVDLDVLGTNNTFLLSTARAGTYAEALASLQQQADAGDGDLDNDESQRVAYASTDNETSTESGASPSSFSTSSSTPLSQVPPEWVGNDLPLKYIDRSNSPTTEAAFRYNLSAPQIYRFASTTNLNRFGEPRSYAIVPRTATLGLLPASHPLMKAAAWTKYSLAVTQRHDSELTCHASMYDFYNPGFPIVSLDDYINGESIVDADLVAWVAVGALHVPRSEDVPLIQNFGVGFSIKPWNYFDHLASLEAERYDKLNWDVCLPNEFGQDEYTWKLY